jgi:hypothetical protein
MNTEANTYARKSDAARALRRIVKNNDKLIVSVADGRYTFDAHAANAAADAQPENDMRSAKDAGVATEVKIVQNEVPKAVTQPTEETTVSKHHNKKSHSAPTKAVTTAHEEVSLEQLKAEEAELKKQEAEAKEVAKKAVDEAKAEAKRQAAEKRELEKLKKAEAAETAKLAKEQAKAQREAEKAAKAEAAKQAKAAAAAERKAARDVAKESARAAKAEAHAKVLAEKKAKKDEREAKRKAKLAEAEERRAAREELRKSREASIRNNIRKPGENSKVGRCWALIEALKEANGTFPTFKAFLSAASQMTYDEVGSEVTQTTAYYDYRMYHNVTGRIVEPKAETPAA